MKNNTKRIKLGIEKLLYDQFDILKEHRIGLICNQSSVLHNLTHVADSLSDNHNFTLTSLYGPQHGIRGEVQDNMIETPHSTDSKTGLPVYSLYSETRIPTDQMLCEVDALVFDIQDIGCRVYTFIYTMANCMIAAKKHGLRMFVCDRPNPVNGVSVEGNILDTNFSSFVGQFPIPMRHGLTVSELALLFNETFEIGCDLTVIPMEGWEREMWFDDTDSPWVMPSPNMPTLDTATVFPSTVFLEGTMLSEGRGTTKPFEIIGAPYICGHKFADCLNKQSLPGVYFRDCGFKPTFQKHSSEFCGGVQIHITDRDIFKPVITGVAIMKATIDLYKDDFEWKNPPYEYIHDKLPIDVIAGTDKLRLGLESGLNLEEMTNEWHFDESNFMKTRKEFLLY